MVTITYAPLGPQYGAMQSLHYVRDDAVWLNMIIIAHLPDRRLYLFFLRWKFGITNYLSIGDTQEHQLDIYQEKESLCVNILNYMP